VSSLSYLGFKLRAGVVLLWLLQVTGVQAQQSPALHPPDYAGVITFIPGVFVTPVAGAPFSGTVEIVSRQSMPDGSVYVRRTTNHIARNSLGVIYNERRKLEAPDFQGEPPVLSSHIYDPQTRVSTFLSPIRTLRDRWFFRGRPRHLRIALPVRPLHLEMRKISRRRIWEQKLLPACCYMARVS